MQLEQHSPVVDRSKSAEGLLIRKVGLKHSAIALQKLEASRKLNFASPVIFRYSQHQHLRPGVGSTFAASPKCLLALSYHSSVLVGPCDQIEAHGVKEEGGPQE